MIDIETDERTGELLAIGLAWHTLAEDVEFRQFATWRQALVFIFSNVQLTPSLAKIWAHNGGGFDYLHMIEYLMLDKSYQCRIASKQGKIIFMEVTHRGVSVTFCDSYRLMPSSLAVLCEQLLPENERKLHIEIPTYELYENDRPAFDRYLERDCRSLIQLLVMFQAAIREQFQYDGLQPTAGSLAMRIFEQAYFTDGFDIPIATEFISVSRAAYTGGRVEVFRYGKFDVRIYDVNSMYPAVMATELFPVGNIVESTELTDCGIYKCTYDQKTGRYPYMPERSGESWLTAPEVRLLRELGRCDIIAGFSAGRCGRIFQRFATDCYALRGRGGIWKIVGKSLGNNLYGKFGQKSEIENIIFVGDGEIPIGSIPILEDGSIVAVKEFKQCRHEFPIIAAHVTAYARIKLWRLMELAGEDLIYVDTDSIHTTGELPPGDGLGELKLEYQGEATYGGKKLYALENKIRVKGVKVGGKMGMPLKFMDIDKLSNGDIYIDCEYESFPTLREIIGGHKAAKTLTRRRKIRRT